MIVKAVVFEADQLTEIALKSKAFWGYSDEIIESWREDLTITAKMFDDSNIYKYLVDDEIAGFYILERVNIRTSILHFLFISPQFIKQGIGKQLLDHAIAYCIEGSSAILNVLSDPNAEAFYAKHGFKVIARRESSIEGRFLPEMELEFPENM
ncbi:GNAT family N-acetyltransferase [Tenacibaculum aquimarinum]|uniref:GNAT family N-acetyltransferase n=1 Tax=Tenacibaculum aquimarinum TaxID=2910675 RepID=UPI001F0B3EC7|nr:GNAT family N-acetyltransferase [Tenacibaculum aquimarinum]MCH3884253.1 GNAT family N-acetyltransferase [Tenacibaculum aquimarinum]